MMMRTNWSSKIAVMMLAFLSSGCTKSAANTPEQQRAASALFAQFESVFYANAELLSGRGGYKQLPEQSANTLRAPFADLLGGLDVLGKPGSDELLHDADAVLVGAKDFRSPGGGTGLGDVQSRFCYIIVLKNRSKFEISKLAGLSSAGGSMWKWSTKGAEGHPEPHTFYAAQTDHSYVLISNNPDDLPATAAKLGSRDNLASSIRDWQSISQHEVWGYRRYRHDEENKVAAGTSEVMPDAQGLAFYVDLKQKTGVLRLYSPTAATTDKMNATHTLPAFKAGSSGTWETAIALTGDQKSSDQMFSTMCLFGFCVYL